MHTQTYKLIDNVLFQKVDNETVILEPETGQYFTLDPIGTFMIENLQLGLTLSQVTENVLKTYKASKNEVETDLQDLINNMVSQGLLMEVSAEVE